MKNQFDQLHQSFLQATGQAIVLNVGHGRFLFSPVAARLVACELPAINENLFWHHPEIEVPEKLSEKILAPGGSLGGDRLWIAPEIAYMWKDLEAARKSPFEHYQLEPDMDPGDYQLKSQSETHVTLSTKMLLPDYRLNKKIGIQVTRTLETVGPPCTLPPQVQWASFSWRHDLELIDGDQGAMAGAWNILQLPPTGTLICPTNQQVQKPRSYFSPFGDKHIVSNERCVRVLIDAKRQMKMGLNAMQTTGRAGYVRRIGNLSTLIVRIFHVQPGKPYIDLPRSSDALQGGDVFQSFNDDGRFGGFGEFEYHDPALIVGQGPTTRTGQSTTHVLAGPTDLINEVGADLLGVPLIDLPT